MAAGRSLMGGSGSMGMMMMGPMHMGDSETIVFGAWTTHSPGTMFGACVCVILISVARHYIMCWRARVASFMGRDNSAAELLARGSAREVRDTLPVAAVKFTMLFASLLVVYFLMLVTMTFNGWLFMSVALGEAIGVTAFAKRTASDAGVTATSGSMGDCHDAV